MPVGEALMSLSIKRRHQIIFIDQSERGLRWIYLERWWRQLQGGMHFCIFETDGFIAQFHRGCIFGLFNPMGYNLF
jgi:hypothetical protein